ncbi:hypothetical protein GWE18_04075 [Bradyrhizobium sp. CSA112]|nr:hypothetical protein [Bradyrhizobium sp. CSA112]
MPIRDVRERLEISFSHGAKWNALINKYIGTIPPRGDAPAVEHNASADPPPNAPVSIAIVAKVGAAAR